MLTGVDSPASVTLGARRLGNPQDIRIAVIKVFLRDLADSIKNPRQRSCNVDDL